MFQNLMRNSLYFKTVAYEAIIYRKMLYLLFTFFCFIISIYGTTVQLWTSDNKLLADVSSCDLCYNLSPEVAETCIDIMLK
jgi:hypothetical protein